MYTLTVGSVKNSLKQFEGLLQVAVYFHLLAQSKQTNKKNSSLLKTSSIWFATYEQVIRDTHIFSAIVMYLPNMERNFKY